MLVAREFSGLLDKRFPWPRAGLLPYPDPAQEVCVFPCFLLCVHPSLSPLDEHLDGASLPALSSLLFGIRGLVLEDSQSPCVQLGTGLYLGLQNVSC